jgi:RNA polymerase sigma-70 factor, ECF subfamily
MAEEPTIVGFEFDDVFVRHFPGLVRALTVVSGNREVAADCVQEAFVRAHLRWDRVSRLDQPVAWIRRVALNVADLDDEVEPPEPPTDLAVLLAELPLRQREALALHYVEGLSVAEVADAMGITEGAVKFHLHQGRERLRPILRESNGR